MAERPWVEQLGQGIETNSRLDVLVVQQVFVVALHVPDDAGHRHLGVLVVLRDGSAVPDDRSMTQVWQSWGGVIVASIVCLPLCVVLVWWRGRSGRRGRHGGGRERWRNPVAEVGLVAGSLPWLWMVMTPVRGPGGVRLVPLADLYAVLRDSPGTAVVQIAGNRGAPMSREARPELGSS
jgi:hypothetical protein